MKIVSLIRTRWRWLAGVPLLFVLLIIAADKIWPLPLNEVSPARVVVAEDGTPLWRFADADGIWRYPVTIEEVSPRYLQALIQYEDRWFWDHPGVNPFSIARAAWQDLRYGRVVSGGSTLTMQVARLLDPHPRTFGGKVRQLWRAMQLEWHLSKRDILTIYLNRAPFGGTLQGVGAASWAYLGKPPSKLSYAEAALLAVLPQAPSRLRPDRWPQRAQAARDKVLDRMVTQQVWPVAQVKESREEPVWLAPRQMPQLAPLFARRMLGANKKLKVTTTLDASLQRQLEELALSVKSRLPMRSSLAIIVVDHTDMKVRGWVGSVDINDDSRFSHVDMVSAVPLLNQVNNLLQPRSALDQARLPRDPRPASVSSGVICWPGGQSLPAGDSNCRRRLATWLLDGSQPPTLLMPEQEGLHGISFPLWLNHQGRRVAADCPDAQQKNWIVWPLPLEPWLPPGERRAARLPPADRICPPRDENAPPPLLLNGVREGAVIKRVPGQDFAILPLQSSGGEGGRWWFLNGEPLTARGTLLSLKLDKAGDYQLVVMDEAGQVAAVQFTVQ